MGKGYTGVDNLEIIGEAKKYNHFLECQTFLHSRGALKALDFGAGIGTFSAALREKGLSITCVEPDSELRQRLESLNFESHADIRDVPENSFDYIYSLNVLEHIEDDLDALKNLYSRLRPGSRIFLYVPAFQCLYSSMDKKVGHFRRYDRRGIKAALESCGFVKIRTRYADSLGFVVTILYKLFGNKRGDLNIKTIKLYDTVFFPISRAMDRFAGRFFGKNIIAVAIRPGPGKTNPS
ncbi:MAG: class I SAM-dependent methyltransferase [Nitrospirota bacterium]